MNIRKGILSLSFTLATLISVAHADGRIDAALQNAKNVCASDIKKFCSDVNPGKGRIAACLDSKSDQISANCNYAQRNLNDTISDRLDKVELAARKNCGDDIKKYCSDVPSGGGRLWDCLAQQEGNLSTSCKTLQSQISSEINRDLG